MACQGRPGLAAGVADAVAEGDPKPIDMKLRVKPVYAGRIHIDAYGGPCRWHPMERMTPEAELEDYKKRCGAFCESVEKNLPKNALLLKPESIVLRRSWKEYEKGDMIDQKDWNKLEADVSEVDLFLTSYRVHGIERYGKPVAWVSQFSAAADWIAFLRNQGLEGYAPYDWDEFGSLVSLLQVRKALRQTKLLLVTDRKGSPPVCVLSCPGADELKQELGIDYQHVTYKEFFAEMDRLAQSGSDREKAKEITARVIGSAIKVHMREDYIHNDVNFYLTVKSLMNRYGCSAFSIRCFELCGSKIASDRKLCPCLANVLLRDEGYPSACEGDTSALLAAMLMMYVSKKSAYMGNVNYDAKKSELHFIHDAAGLRMRGIAGPDSAYEIQPFTHESTGSFGTTIRYDFSRDVGEVVTIARANTSKLLLTKGEIVAGHGFRSFGCSLGFKVRVPDALELYHKAAEVGNHLAVVYGDYTRELRDLADLMKFELLEVTRAS